jgi:hypothetical protein
LISKIYEVTKPSQYETSYSSRQGKIPQANQRPYAASIEPSLRQKRERLADRVRMPRLDGDVIGHAGEL